MRSSPFLVSSTFKMTLACVLAFFVLLPLSSAQFRAIPTYSTDNVQPGAQPGGVVSADFNGDGKPDLAVANYAGNSVAILLNNGDGTFQPAVTFSTPAENSARSIVAADFNGDGKMDIATSGTGCCGGQIAVFLGNGDGTFQQGVLYWPLGNDAGTIKAVDLNGDGKLDLLIGSNSSTGLTYGQLYVLLGNGDGSFQSPIVTTTTILGQRPDLVVGDFNHDSKTDVAMEVGGQLMVLLGNGDGTFGAPTIYTSSDSVSALAAGDLNNDGNLDLIAGTDGNLNVFLGNSDGTFQPAVVTVLSEVVAAGAIALADMNRDGKLDVILGTSGTSSLSVLLGNGTAHLGPQTPYASGSGPASPGAIWAADLNGDGYTDIVCTNNGEATLSILFGSPAGKLASSILRPTFNAGPMAVGDFNNDGNLDLAVVAQGGHYFGLFLGDGKGRLSAPTDIDASGPMSITAADFNGDGNLDVATGNGKDLSVFFGKGHGTFDTPVNYVASSNIGNQNSFITAVDLNGDGKPDLAVITQLLTGQRVIAIMLNNGKGAFLPAVQYTVSGNPLNLAFADFNRDGKMDMAACDSKGYISVFLGNGDGTFGTRTDYFLPCSQVATADVNGDGIPDLVIATGYLGIMLGNGDGTFQAATFDTDVITTDFVAPADFNGDGKVDIGAYGPNSNFGVYYGNGDGTFTYTDYGQYDPGVIVGDFNGDNRPDVAIWDKGGVFVLLNTGGK